MDKHHQLEPFLQLHFGENNVTEANIQSVLKMMRETSVETTKKLIGALLQVMAADTRFLEPGDAVTSFKPLSEAEIKVAEEAMQIWDIALARYNADVSGKPN